MIQIAYMYIIIVIHSGILFLPITEREEGCIGSRLSLRCAELKVIEVTDVVLGDSECKDNSCCITDQDCTGTASATHVTDVQHRCNGQINCTVEVIKELFACVSEFNSSNDFERITYNCIDDKRSKRASSFRHPKQLLLIRGHPFMTSTRRGEGVRLRW